MMTAITTTTERMGQPPKHESEPAGLARGFWRVRGIGNAAPPRSATFPHCFLLVLAMMSVELAGSGGRKACAQVLVEGPPEAVHIDARDAPLQEVLDALRTKFNFRYRTSDVLDTWMTGTFDGPLPRVTARILAGYDFAMKIAPQDIDVLILRQNMPKSNAITAATPAGTVPNRSPAPVMTAAQANRYERGQFR